MSISCSETKQTKRPPVGKSGYTKDVIELIETVYGEGFLSQGSCLSADHMVEGIDLNGKRMLDLGCGTGGIDFYFAQRYAVDIVGVDIEPFMLQLASKRLLRIQSTFRGSVTFFLEGPTDYLKQFGDNSFDIIFSKESILHIRREDKTKYFKQVYRVLKPGGKIIIMDWMHASPEYSQELRDMINLDGLPYNLVTIQSYVGSLSGAMFKNICFVDTTQQSIRLCEQDYKKVVARKDAIERKFGAKTYEDSLASWFMQWKVFQNKELLTGVFRAEK